ncbi:hypothetical protein BDA99DRAFT_537913 [Phascolomyces articulosus]|uniref:Uncharacterized protein n=1 Tax=Phascolomyces articulosus TaxID=60185 RepID=A0AAD5KC80_9FUNG|nr:hypothetical protein BDA99DRAFT_537913 [Phascolomyces articulosus]
MHANDGQGDYVKYHRQLPKSVPDALPKPEFMPTKLVRISDMQVMDGSQVNEGYCALSYAWNQSGEIIQDGVTGKYKRIDEGKHKIIQEERDNSGKNTDNNQQEQREEKYVKFEGVIQQICQQFNIKYIWYGQICIC